MTNQIVQATLPVQLEPIVIGGTKTERNADDVAGPPATPVTIQLDFGNDGIFDGSNDQAVTTDPATGGYAFTIDPNSFDPGAFPLTYSVQEVSQSGRVFFSPADGKYTFSIAADGTVTSLRQQHRLHL
ncbi:MAG: hypothetical protein R3C05_10375 [Pirellulaceae bacterium]